MGNRESIPSENKTLKEKTPIYSSEGSDETLVKNSEIKYNHLRPSSTRFGIGASSNARSIAQKYDIYPVIPIDEISSVVDSRYYPSCPTYEEACATEPYNRVDLSTNAMANIRVDHNRDLQEPFSLSFNGQLNLNAKEKNGDNLVREVVHFLSEFSNFSADLNVIMALFNTKQDDLLKLIRRNTFVFKIDGDKIYLNPRMSICGFFEKGEACMTINCNDLHICLNHLLENCPTYNCLSGHVLKTNHNIKVLRTFSLDNISDEVIISLLKRNYGYIYPLEICYDYNREECNRGRYCEKLHICQLLLQWYGKCPSGNLCPFNHNFREESCSLLLNKAGISVNDAPRDLITLVREKCMKNNLTEASLKDQSQLELDVSSQLVTASFPSGGLERNKYIEETEEFKIKNETGDKMKSSVQNEKIKNALLPCAERKNGESLRSAELSSCTPNKEVDEDSLTCTLEILENSEPDLAMNDDVSQVSKAVNTKEKKSKKKKLKKSKRKHDSSNVCNDCLSHEESTEKGKYLESAPNFEVEKITKTVKHSKVFWFDSIGNVEIPFTCIDYINRTCNSSNTPCMFLNSKFTFYWQVYSDQNYYNFSLFMCKILENRFRDPFCEVMHLPKLSYRHLNSHRYLLDIIGTQESKVNLEKMTLERLDNGKIFTIRRLSTPSSVVNRSKYSTAYQWYAKIVGKKFVPVGKIGLSSASLEILYIEEKHTIHNVSYADFKF